MSVVQKPEQRVEWLDVLRGLAAFAVVLFHVRVTMWVGLRELASTPTYSTFDRVSAWLTLPFPLFGTAVMLFFVVSGFAIHYPYGGAQRPMDLRAYGFRRCFRIYPPYAAAVLLTVAAEFAAALLVGAPVSSWAKVGASLAMTQNYMPPAGQMVGNPSLWSLPVEIELYLAYPLLLWFWRRFGTVRMVAVVTLVSAAAAAPVAAGHAWPMTNFAKYWILWVSGAVLAEQVRTHTLPRWRVWWWGIAGTCLALAIAARATGVPFGFEHFLWGVIYFLVLLWGLNRQVPPLRILPDAVTRALLRLGDISYSLYLVHFPVFLALGALWIAVFGSKPTNVLVPLAASLVTIPVAYVMWRFVERPSQAWGRAASLPASTVATRVATGPIAS